MVIAILTVIVGAITLKRLPISEYPPVSPTMIQVTTTYRGAAAEAVMESVATPIESKVNGVDKLLYIPLLRDVGRHFSVNRMLTMDSVRLRLEREQPLSFLEFNYMVLQSYDFVELARRYGCNLQMGGSDQWGNIVMASSSAAASRTAH